MYDINLKDYQNLNHSYFNHNSSLHFIYGSTKSGKTTLMRSFIIKKNHIYFDCSPTSKSILYPRLASIINSKFKQKNLLNIFKTFENVLELLVNEPLNEKLSIIFDNFQDLLKVDKNALEILLSYWDKYLKNKNIQIIILSSLQLKDNISKKFLKYEKENFFMETISFENINMRKNINWLDKLYIFSFLGTSDIFLRHYNPKLDFIKNIYKIALEVNSPFFRYGFDYLKQDISDISTYSSILYSISKGHNKIGEIASFIDLKSTDLSRYIKKLQDLFIIKKELPIGDTFKNSKYGRYYINDKFLKFWFCYIFDNFSLLEMKKYQSVLKLINTNFVKDIVEPSYKDFILNLINDDPKKYLGFTPHKIGKWWDNTNEIDIIAYDNKEISFVSIIWDTADAAKIHYGLLKNISNTYKSNLKRNYIIISKNTYLNMNKVNNG
jgi:AAA+ ATPase superfamily predicted ATPase